MALESYKGKLNDERDIFAALVKDHRGVIHETATAGDRAKYWLLYFNGGACGDPEMEGEPFLDYVATNVFNWCGCNTGTDSRLVTLYRIMKAFEDHRNKLRSFEERDERLSKIWGTWESGDLIMDFFSNMGMFSHGGSNGGSWIDLDGPIVYAHLCAWVEKNREFLRERGHDV